MSSESVLTPGRMISAPTAEAAGAKILRPDVLPVANLYVTSTQGWPFYSLHEGEADQVPPGVEPGDPPYDRQVLKCSTEVGTQHQRQN